jgi:hypothetical protein
MKGEEMIIRCMTCGKTFKKENDVISCFEAEHQLPEAHDLPDPFPRDAEKQLVYLSIFLFGQVRQGLLIHRGGSRFKVTEKYREEIKAAHPSPNIN